MDTSYFRDIVSSLEKALYYERGRGGYFRATMVGTDFIDRQDIRGETPVDVIENCIKVFVAHKMLDKISYQKDESGEFFTFKVTGCSHLSVEARLKEEGVPTFVCAPVNMILHKIRQLTDLAVEIADIRVNQEDGECVIRVVVFKQN
jgi:hypothetical protein